MSWKTEANSSKTEFMATEGMHHDAVKCATICKLIPYKSKEMNQIIQPGFHHRIFKKKGKINKKLFQFHNGT